MPRRPPVRHPASESAEAFSAPPFSYRSDPSLGNRSSRSYADSPAMAGPIETTGWAVGPPVLATLDPRQDLWVAGIRSPVPASQIPADRRDHGAWWPGPVDGSGCGRTAGLPSTAPGDRFGARRHLVGSRTVFKNSGA